MNRFIGRTIACLLIVCGAAEAQAQVQNNACSLGVGADAKGQMKDEPAVGFATEQDAGRAVIGVLRQKGYEPLKGDTMTAGAIAMVIYRDRTGTIQSHFSKDYTALSAITRVLDAVGGPGRDPTYPPYVRWVNCLGTEMPTMDQLKQMTWGNALRQHYPGSQADVRILQRNDGLLLMASQATPPPPPTPAPAFYPLGNPLGCWKRGDGNVISITPSGTANDGSQEFTGVNVVLAPGQAQTGAKAGSYALKFHVLNSKPGYFHGGYHALDGWDQTSQFLIQGNTLSTVVVASASRPPREMFTWQRVECPR